MGDIRASLLGKLPSGDGNGINSAELAKDPASVRIGVVLFDADRTVVKTDDDNEEVRARIRRIEVLSGDAATTARELMEARFTERTGAQAMDFGDDPEPDQPAEAEPAASPARKRSRK